MESKDKMNKIKKRIYHFIWTRASRIYKWASNKEFELMVADGTIPQSTIEKWKGHNRYIRPYSTDNKEKNNNE